MYSVVPRVWLLSLSITCVIAGVSPHAFLWPSNAPLNGYTPSASPFIIPWTRGLFPPRGYCESAARTAVHAFLRGRVFSLLRGGYQEWNRETYGDCCIIRGTARRLSKAAPPASLPAPAIFIGKVPSNGERGVGTKSECRDRRPDCCPRGRECVPSGLGGPLGLCPEQWEAASSSLMYPFPTSLDKLRFANFDSNYFYDQKNAIWREEKGDRIPHGAGNLLQKPVASGLQCLLSVLHPEDPQEEVGGTDLDAGSISGPARGVGRRQRRRDSLTWMFLSVTPPAFHCL